MDTHSETNESSGHWLNRHAQDENTYSINSLQGMQSCSILVSDKPMNHSAATAKPTMCGSMLSFEKSHCTSRNSPFPFSGSNLLRSSARVALPISDCSGDAASPSLTGWMKINLQRTVQVLERQPETLVRESHRKSCHTVKATSIRMNTGSKHRQRHGLPRLKICSFNGTVTLPDQRTGRRT